MDISVDTATTAEPERLFRLVEDLSAYPSWMGLVHAVSVVASDVWDVELRGRIGPFARSKRLRMRRTVHESPRHARFERDESDGRQHGRWVLDAVVEPTAEGGSRLEMTLHYGGRLWSAVVERALLDEVEASKRRLAESLAQ